jgi:hypothetical protein
MESETKRINKNDDKPISESAAPNICQTQGNQQQVIPVNIQQGNMQQNQVILPQQQYLVNQPITYQPLNNQPYNQGVIVNPGQPNLIINQAVPVIYKPIEFGYRRVNMVCPYCNNSIKTNIETKFNCLTCCTFFLCILLIIVALANGNVGDCGGCGSSRNSCCCCCCCCYHKTKEEEEEEEEVGTCNCFNDAIHTCPSCGQFLGKHKTCCG